MLLLSIVVPFLNEKDTVEAFADFARRLTVDVGNRFDLAVEIVLVDDGSTDDSVARYRRAMTGNWRIVELSRNFGKEIALFAGMEAARGDFILPMDADLQHPYDVCLQLIETLLADDQLDVVYSVRDDRSAESLTKKTTARLFYRLINLRQRFLIPEDAGDFRIMRRAFADAFVQVRDRRRFNKGLYAWTGFRQKGISYTPDQRVAGTTKWGTLSLLTLLIEGITSFSALPLRLISAIGALVGILGVFYGAKIIIEALLFGTDVPGFPSLMSAISVLGGFNLMLLGLLGEYLWVAVSEVKDRPIYFVRRIHTPDRSE